MGKSNKWTPINSADGKYEMCRAGHVRNAKTKQLLKPIKGRKRHVVFQLRIKGRTVKIRQTALFAEVFGDGGKGYLPILSLDYKYEINPRGKVRNVKTKALLRTYSDNRALMVKTTVKGKAYAASVQQLLWEVFGINPKLKRIIPVSATVKKDGVAYCFKSLYAAAKFLSPRVFLGVSAVRQHLSRREKVVEGWEVIYREPEQRIFRDVSVIIGDKYIYREEKYWRDKNDV